MIKPEDLRKGNLVEALFSFAIPGIFGRSYTRIESLHEKEATTFIDYPHNSIYEQGLAIYKDIQPIPLTAFWREQLRVNYNLPSHVTAVHELQNWYYWNNKQEISLDKLPFFEGDNLDMDALLIREAKYNALLEHPKLPFLEYQH